MHAIHTHPTVCIFTHSVLNINGVFILEESMISSSLKESKMAATWGQCCREGCGRGSGFKIQLETPLHFKEKGALGKRKD